jgi:hypothetical protein
VYVCYRTPNPDNETVAEVKKIFEEKGMNYSQMVEWTTDHCQTVNFVYKVYVLVRNVVDPIASLLDPTASKLGPFTSLLNLIATLLGPFTSVFGKLVSLLGPFGFLTK